MKLFNWQETIKTREPKFNFFVDNLDEFIEKNKEDIIIAFWREEKVLPTEKQIAELGQDIYSEKIQDDYMDYVNQETNAII